MKRRIKLNENQLRNVIKESIYRILNESHRNNEFDIDFYCEIELPEEMGGELCEVEINATGCFWPAEKRTYDYPGCDASVDFYDIKLTPNNDDVLSPEEKEYVEKEWIPSHEDELKQKAEDKLYEMYEMEEGRREEYLNNQWKDRYYETKIADEDR